MNPSVFIFGTDHKLQCGNKKRYSTNTLNEFREHLHRIIEEHGIAFIAEEMARNRVFFFSEACASETIAAAIAQELDLIHCYIDIDEKTTTNLCILPEQLEDVSKSLAATDHNSEILFGSLKHNLRHGIRERVWIARIYAANLWPTLFICGADHVMNLQALLCQTGCESRIIEMDYDPAPGDPDEEEDHDEQQKAMDEVLSNNTEKDLPHTSD